MVENHKGEIVCPFARLDIHQNMMICKHPYFGEYALCALVLKALGCPQVLEMMSK